MLLEVSIDADFVQNLLALEIIIIKQSLNGVVQDSEYNPRRVVKASRYFECVDLVVRTSHIFDSDARVAIFIRPLSLPVVRSAHFFPITLFLSTEFNTSDLFWHQISKSSSPFYFFDSSHIILLDILDFPHLPAAHPGVNPVPYFIANFFLVIIWTSVRKTQLRCANSCYSRYWPVWRAVVRIKTISSPLSRLLWSVCLHARQSVFKSSDVIV